MTEKRRYFIASVGKPGEGYDEDNLIRCIEYNCHAMHRDTKQKGVFKDVAEHSICFLKFKDNLIGYGEVKNTSTKPNKKFGDWNWIIEVNEWIFYDKKGKRNGISNYGVSDAVIGGSIKATIKEIKQDYALQKMKEIDSTSQLYKQIMSEINYSKKVDLLTTNKNLILTGAPGVGKTYTTAEIAVALCDGEEKVPNERSKLMKRYNELVDSKQIAFTTFHQSLDYEEFVEGLKPEVAENKQVTYEVKAGIFKTISTNARDSDLIKRTEFDNVFKRFTDNLSKKINSQQQGEYYTIPTTRTNLNIIKIDAEQIITKGGNAAQEYPISKEQLSNMYYSRVSNTRDASRFVDWGSNGFTVLEEYRKFIKQDSSDLISKNKQNYLLIIDEINRGNISKIFGELITLLEKDKRLGEENEITVTLPYSQETFGVPSNLYIIGTMNTADRSIGAIDYALRRRFAFVSLKSDKTVISNYTEYQDDTKTKAENLFDNIKTFIESNINEDLDAEDLMVGHSYFLCKTKDDLKRRLEYEIIPLLWEYQKDGILTCDRKTLKDKITEWNAILQ